MLPCVSECFRPCGCFRAFLVRISLHGRLGELHQRTPAVQFRVCVLSGVHDSRALALSRGLQICKRGARGFDMPLDIGRGRALRRFHTCVPTSGVLRGAGGVLLHRVVVLRLRQPVAAEPVRLLLAGGFHLGFVGALLGVRGAIERPARHRGHPVHHLDLRHVPGSEASVNKLVGLHVLTVHPDGAVHVVHRLDLGEGLAGRFRASRLLGVGAGLLFRSAGCFCGLLPLRPGPVALDHLALVLGHALGRVKAGWRLYPLASLRDRHLPPRRLTALAGDLFDLHPGVGDLRLRPASGGLRGTGVLLCGVDRVGADLYPTEVGLNDEVRRFAPRRHAKDAIDRALGAGLPHHNRVAEIEPGVALCGLPVREVLQPFVAQRPIGLRDALRLFHTFAPATTSGGLRGGCGLHLCFACGLPFGTDLGPVLAQHAGIPLALVCERLFVFRVIAAPRFGLLHRVGRHAVRPFRVLLDGIRRRGRTRLDLLPSLFFCGVPALRLFHTFAPTPTSGGRGRIVHVCSFGYNLCRLVGRRLTSHDAGPGRLVLLQDEGVHLVHGVVQGLGFLNPAV